jgi:soluble lytic murein transglycosylase-like protein
VLSALQQFASELSRRRVVRVVVGYSVAVFGALQGLDVVATRLELPGTWMRWVVIGALAGLPIAAVLSWIFDWTPEGVVRTASAPARETPAVAGPRATLLLATLASCLALATVVAILAWRHTVSAPAASPASTGEPGSLDATLKEVLSAFHADAVAPPAWFRERIRRHVDRLAADPRTRSVIYPRMKQWWPLLARKLAEHGVTEELGYVAWVESEFNLASRGPGADPAVGLWSFTARTARAYGLRVDEKQDDRLDPALSTDAAARYFANLFAEFGADSFMLALASYNMGENKLRRTLTALAQRPGGLRPEDRNFWQLYRLQALPEETLEYVPKVLAVAILCHDPARYGLE